MYKLNGKSIFARKKTTLSEYQNNFERSEKQK